MSEIHVWSHTASLPNDMSLVTLAHIKNEGITCQLSYCLTLQMSVLYVKYYISSYHKIGVLLYSIVTMLHITKLVFYIYIVTLTHIRKQVNNMSGITLLHITNQVY